MDHGKPITPGEVLRYAAGRTDGEGLRYRADKLRRDAAVLLAQADVLDEVRRDLEGEARRFDQYQPTTPTPGAPA